MSTQPALKPESVGSPSKQPKLLQGTPAWFEMVGDVMSKAALAAGLPADLNVSFQERYTDGEELDNGRIQGLRFDLRSGKPTFRLGVAKGEQADITVNITAAAARALNLLYSADPAYHATRNTLLETGEMRVEGDPLRLGTWLDAVHDPIVERTA